MKKTNVLLLAGTIAAFCCSIGHAQNQIIYDQDFTGGSATSLNGVAPTYASDFAGGSSSATWNVLTNSGTAFINQDGTISGTANTALLSFIPQSGYLYTLVADISFTGNPGSWLDLGFALHNPASNTGSGKMNDTSATAADGVDWAIFSPATRTEQFFGGPSTGNAFASTNAAMEGTGEWIVTITLNTEASQWTTSESFEGLSGQGDGKSYLSPDFDLPSASTNIVALAFGNNAISNPSIVTWNSLQLTATPEPSAMALTGLGAGVLLLVCKKRKRA